MTDDRRREPPTHENQPLAAHRLPPESPHRRGWLEVLVDPRTLGILMLCGGGLLVVGLVVWLWSYGVFDNPLVAASCLGAANLVVLVAGIATVHRSRFQTAGKALTMLACLVMPLHLWFYDAQGLITLADGGHLWVPALVCCAVYGVVARILADSRLVYAIVAGVTATGMLFLADRDIGRFWEIMAPSTFLVVLGMISIHLERAFAPGPGPFSRQKFGRAFFDAGHAVMALGLVVMVAARVVGWFYQPWFAELGWFPLPALATDDRQQLLALALSLGALYSYVYSLLMTEAGWRYLASAGLTCLWCAALLLDLLAIPITVELLALLAAAGALLAHLAANYGHWRVESLPARAGRRSIVEPLAQRAEPLAAAMSTVAVLLGAVLYARARVAGLHEEMPFQFGGLYVLAMVLAAISCWWNASRSRHAAERTMSTERNLLAMMAASLFATAGLAACVGLPLTWATLALEMLLPLAAAGGSLALRAESSRQSLARAAEVGALFVLSVGMGAIFGFVNVAGVQQPHLWMAILLAEAALGFALASVHASRNSPLVGSAVSSCAAVWQLLLWLGVTQYGFNLAALLVGVAGLTIDAVAAGTGQPRSRWTLVCQWTGRLAVTIGCAATILMALGRLVVGETEWPLVGVLAGQVAVAIVAGLLARQPAWQRHFFVFALGGALVALLVVNSLSVLNVFQRIETMLTAGGLLMLVAGYVGWHRETDRTEPWVDFNLALGSLLSSLPLTIGLVAQRLHLDTADWGWVVVHEAGALAIGLVLLASGLLCRLRWSTLAGAATLVVYLVSLAGLFSLPDRLQTTAVYMMIGGGSCFVVALLLSIYRDRLLALPRQAREGKGLFQVLYWR